MKLLSSLLFGLVLTGGHAVADEARLSFGGDEFAAGQLAAVNQPMTERDAFVAGYDVSLTGIVKGDAHLAGFNVRDDAEVQGDVYAVGFTVNVAGSTGGDLTAMGNTVNVGAAAPISGNVRAAGESVSISAPIGGSALITARTLTLDAPLSGDLNFFGENISFGPKAAVAGKITIQAPAAIAVPATVAAADRVSFQQLVTPDYVSQAGKTAEHVVNSFWPAVWATGLWWLLLLVVGLAFVSLASKLVEVMRVATITHPIRNVGLGFLAFASVLGLIPISAITLIGLLLTPFFVLFAVVMCSLAYLAGVYLVGVQLIGRFANLDTLPMRAMALAGSIVVAGLLAMLPLVGWLITLLFVAFGYGAIAQLVLGRSATAAGPAGHDSSPLQAPEAV